MRKKVIEENIIILDARFPSDSYKGFRTPTIHGLLDARPDIKAYSYALNYPPCSGFRSKSIKDHLKYIIKYLINQLNFSENKYQIGSGYFIDFFTGLTKKKFEINRNHYLSLFPGHKKQVLFIDYKAKYKASLAYIIFLDVAYDLLPFLEHNQIPFVFDLTARGGFAINSADSDRKLKRIFCSSMFRKVAPDSEYIKKYLLDNQLCTEEEIFLYKTRRAVIREDQIKEKVKYPSGKKIFDIAFVAHKYMPKGLDKGYDLFIDTAKMLVNKYDCMKFHVVGGFNENDIDVSTIKDRITFYGVRDLDFLANFYRKIDIFLSPNRPFILGPGKFDGFPLGGSHAQVCGVALFVTDELNLNKLYSTDEIVILKPHVTDITEKIEYYFNNVDELYKLSEKGQQKRLSISNPQQRIIEQLVLFDNIIKGVS